MPIQLCQLVRYSYNVGRSSLIQWSIRYLKRSIFSYSVIVLCLSLIEPITVTQLRAEPIQTFVYPVMAPRRSSDFGKRVHPIRKAVRHHNGVDLAAPTGAPIRSVADGLVVFADSYAKYGNLVTIQHTGGLTTLYGHCEKISVQPGQTVRAGQIIGTVGNTGGSTGPHLHFETRINGKPHDPDKFIPALTDPVEE
jgi:murein DD-endopeptidase MepM/ murein hydrolase activator NlpD